MKIRSKDYAEKAYPLVKKMQADEKIKNSEKDKYDEQRKLEVKYRTLALNFPTMILQSGLVQAVGFLMAKDEAEHQKLASHISRLLGYQAVEDLHKHLLRSDITEYQLLTRKAIDAASWLKRYTQALLKKEGEK